MHLPKMTSTHVPYTAASETIDSFVRERLTGHEALYDLDLDKLREVDPDVIISQALCDVCAVASGDVTKALRSLPGTPTLIDLTPSNLDDVLNDIRRVGVALGNDTVAIRLAETLAERRNAVAQRTATIPLSDRPRVAFLEWLLPPFNGGHWNPELVTLAGGIDLLGAKGRPSSTLSWADVAKSEPEVLFVACCGFDVDRAMQDVVQMQAKDVWQQLPAVNAGRVYVADGNAFFSCPSPRLIDGLEIMAHALHPSYHPELFGDACHNVHHN